MITQEIVNDTLSKLKDKSDEELVHIWKICSSRTLNSEKKLVAPLMKKIESLRKTTAKKIKAEKDIDETNSESTEEQ